MGGGIDVLNAHRSAADDFRLAEPKGPAAKGAPNSSVRLGTPGGRGGQGGQGARVLLNLELPERNLPFELQR